MAGLLNASTQKAPEPTDPILKQIEEGIDAKVSPKLKKQYLSMVVAGMDIMFSSTTGQRVMQKLKTTQDVVTDVSSGVANVVAMVINEVMPKMKPADKQLMVGAAVPASIALMCQALDAWSKITKQEVTSDMANACVQATTKQMLAKLNITNDKINQVVSAGRQQGGQGQPQAGAQ